MQFDSITQKILSENVSLSIVQVPVILLFRESHVLNYIGFAKKFICYFFFSNNNILWKTLNELFGQPNILFENAMVFKKITN